MPMRTERSITIDGRRIGPGRPTFVVAEMSGNHNGSIERALRIVEAAKDAGADAIKLQTYRADTITIDHGAPEFVLEGGLWDGWRLFDLYEEAHTPWMWHADIFARARALDLVVFSTPFDPTAIDFLEDMGCPAYKIASPEIVDLPLIGQAAATGKPIILSTGMASLRDIEEAVATARDRGASEIAVLHCTSAYPAPVGEANLSTMADIARRLDVVVGLSDHTTDITVAAVAAGMGACIIEKHFTLARADGGVDSAFSLEPNELAQLVRQVRVANDAVGVPSYTPTPSERTALTFRRSLYVVADVRAGDPLTHENVRSIRPGSGLPPKMLETVLGRNAARDLYRGEPLDASMFDVEPT